MAEAAQYIKMMLDSLIKKEDLLNQIVAYNQQQKELAEAEKMDMDAFSVLVDKKQGLILEIQKLDDGFQALYDRIKEELTSRKGLYKIEIMQMQDYIKRLSDLSIKIQAQEEQNRQLLQVHFSQMKKDVKIAKKSVKVATDYYKSMSKLNVVDSQFVDKKK